MSVAFPRFIVVHDEPPDDIAPGMLVVAIGDADVAPAWAVAVLRDPADAARLDPRAMVVGVCAVVVGETPELDRILRALANRFVKHVTFPLSDPAAPDEYGLRETAGMDSPGLAVQTTIARNMELLLRSPRVETLAGVASGAAVLIVSPGPSLRGLDRLRDYAERAVVICLARCLGHCLDAGVVPDFIVQRDPHLVNAHYYPRDERLRESCLVASAVHPVFAVAEWLRGSVFLDHIDERGEVGPSGLRESYLSSTFAALGLAELIGATTLLLAGVDFSYPDRGGRYVHESGSCAQEECAVVDLPGESVFARRGVDGERALTRLHYYACLDEARSMGLALRRKGVRAVNLTGCGLLDADVFPPETPAPEALPALDRDALHAAVDTALAVRPRFDPQRLAGGLWERAARLRAADPSLRGFTDFTADLPGAEAERLTRSMADAAAEATEEAAALARLVGIAAAGGGVDVVCLGEEAGGVRERVRALWPGLESRAHVVLAQTEEPAREPGDVGRIPYTRLAAWFAEREVVLVTREARAAFAEFFDLARPPGVITM